MEKGKWAHFVGIGGIGMSGLAKVMLEDGWRVSGSDLKPSPLTQRLAAQGATVYSGHHPQNLGQADLVIISSAVPQDNVEVQEALRRGTPMLKRAQMLGRLMKARRGIAVAGTHGKTTTTTLIALMAQEGGLDPTILAGGEIIELGTNAKLGRGWYLVAEADEFDGAFLELSPWIAVVTNIEPEHLDYYGDFPALVEAFRRFMSLVPQEGYIVACGDDPQVRALAEELSLSGLDDGRFITYGLGEGLEWRATQLRPNQGGWCFTLEHGGASLGEFFLPLAGRHNVLNSLAAIGVSALLDISLETARKVLGRFKGVRRRFEIKGELGGVMVVDDYAHHPTEIRATLEAARERYGGRRLWCIFQPHTFSRTKLLLGEFSTSFEAADEVIITAIYPAREKDDLGISGADLAWAIRRPLASYIADLHLVAQEVRQRLLPGDVVMTLGAGDVDKVGEEILRGLAEDEGRIHCQKA